MGFTSSASPSPQRMGFASWGCPSPKRMGFASWRSPLSRGSPSPSEWDSPQGAPSLSTANGIHFKGVPFSKANGIRLKGVPLSNANESRLKGFPPLQCKWDSLQGGPLLQSEWDLLQGIPSLHSDSVSLQRTLLHLDISTHPVLRLRIPPLRDPICGLLLPSIFPSKGDKEADESSLTAPVKAMIDFILKELPGCPGVTFPSFVEIFRPLSLCRSYRRCDSLGIAFGLVPCDVRCLL